jgi:hypothetical protein
MAAACSTLRLSATVEAISLVTFPHTGPRDATCSASVETRRKIARLLDLRVPLHSSRPLSNLTNYVLCIVAFKSLLPSAFGQVPLVRLPLPTSNDSLPGIHPARLIRL